MSGFGYNVLGFGANASSAAAGGASDDQFNRVSFLSHFDGANNGVNNVFDDGSASNHTITANGNATQGSFGPFARPDGEWAVSSDGSGDSLSTSSSADFALGTGDFTVEFFVYHAATPSATTYFDYRSASNQSTLYLWLYGDTGAIQLNIAGTTRAFTPPSMLSRWAHIAIARSSGTTKTFVDGTQYLSFSDSTDYVQGSTFYIGRFYGSDSENINGAISNFRWIKGTAVYTSAFTAPTAPLTAVTNTKLLTCQSNRFVDNSASGHTVTPAGNAAVTAFGPILSSAVYDAAVNGASAYFDNSASTYLSAADSADWDFGSDNYTVEFWMYVTRSGVYQGIFNHWGDFSGSNIAWSFEINSSNRLAFLFKAGGITSVTISSSLGDYLNQWVHVAAVRNSNVHTVYLNGVSKASTTNSSAINNCTDVLRVGAYHADYGFDGYICDARIVKGTAVYTGNFTPPTAPLTAITNTKLLLNMADGQAIDSAAQNNLTLLGNTDTSTGQAKFGNTSLFYDGSGDGAYYEKGAALGTGDWTIETFLWVNDFDADLGVFQYGGAVGALGALILTNQKIRVVSNNIAVRLETSGTINAQTWYHVAYVSYNGTIKVYINGTADSTTFDASSTTWTFTDTTVYVGARYYSSAVQAPFDGYLDEFRVSHFARYTSNFTAPTAAFADKGQ